MMIGSGNGGDLPEPGTHAEIVLADGGGAPGDALVLVLEHLRARQPPPVVQHAARLGVCRVLHGVWCIGEEKGQCRKAARLFEHSQRV